MKYSETHIIYNTISNKSGLNEEALKLIGITKDKIDTAMHQCVSSGMSRKAAMRTIYKMWNYAEPEDTEQNDSASPSEDNETK